MSQKQATSDSSPIIFCFQSYLRALVGASLALSLLDLALVAVRSPESSVHFPPYFLLTWGSALWVAAALTACCAAVELLLLLALRAHASVMLEKGLRFFACSVGSSFVAVVLIKPWNLYITWPYFVLPVVSLTTAAVFVLAKRKLSERVVRSALLVTSLLLFASDSFLFRKLYLSLHNTVFFLAFSTMAAAMFRLPPLRKKWSWAILGAAAATQLVLVSSLPEARDLGMRYGTVGPKVLSVLHLTADMDGDGHSAIFSGGDCNDGDPQVHPGACEHDNQDRNCNGHVGLSERSVTGLRTRRKATSSLAHSPDIYLVMVDTLRGDFG